jgi:hypothetical protein
MTTALVHLNIPPKRMLSETEGAIYCGRPVKRFKVECPVSPIVLANGDRRYDVRDLDKWIDALKGDQTDADAIIARLG